MKKKMNNVVINGREHEIDKKKICFEELVEIAFGNCKENDQVVYTVSFSIEDGAMVKGDCIQVFPGTVFNVTKTDKS